MIFITGDTHGEIDISKLNSRKFPEQKNLEITELNDYLNKINSRLDFKHWYFGHNHLDENLTNKHTILYNKIIRLN
jgi:hypothetical protein